MINRSTNMPAPLGGSKDFSLQDEISQLRGDMEGLFLDLARDKATSHANDRLSISSNVSLPYNQEDIRSDTTSAHSNHLLQSRFDEEEFSISQEFIYSALRRGDDYSIDFVKWLISKESRGSENSFSKNAREPLMALWTYKLNVFRAIQQTLEEAITASDNPYDLYVLDTLPDTVSSARYSGSLVYVRDRKTLYCAHPRLLDHFVINRNVNDCLFTELRTFNSDADFSEYQLVKQEAGMEKRELLSYGQRLASPNLDDSFSGGAFYYDHQVYFKDILLSRFNQLANYLLDEAYRKCLHTPHLTKNRSRSSIPAEPTPEWRPEDFFESIRFYLPLDLVQFDSSYWHIFFENGVFNYEEMLNETKRLLDILGSAISVARQKKYDYAEDIRKHSVPSFTDQDKDDILRRLLTPNENGTFDKIPFDCREKIDRIIDQELQLSNRFLMVSKLAPEAQEALKKLLDGFVRKRRLFAGSNLLQLRGKKVFSSEQVKELLDQVRIWSPSPNFPSRDPEQDILNSEERDILWKALVPEKEPVDVSKAKPIYEKVLLALFNTVSPYMLDTANNSLILLSLMYNNRNIAQWLFHNFSGIDALQNKDGVSAKTYPLMLSYPFKNAHLMQSLRAERVLLEFERFLFQQFDKWLKRSLEISMSSNAALNGNFFARFKESFLNLLDDLFGTRMVFFSRERELRLCLDALNLFRYAGENGKAYIEFVNGILQQSDPGVLKQSKFHQKCHETKVALESYLDVKIGSEVTFDEHRANQTAIRKQRESEKQQQDLITIVQQESQASHQMAQRTESMERSLALSQQKAEAFEKELEHQKLVSQQKTEALAKKLEATEEQNQDLKQEVKGLAETNQDLKQEVKGLAETNQDLKQEVKGLTEKNEAMKKELEANSQKSQYLEGELKELKTMMFKLLGERERNIPTTNGDSLSSAGLFCGGSTQQKVAHEESSSELNR